MKKKIWLMLDLDIPQKINANKTIQIHIHKWNQKYDARVNECARKGITSVCMFVCVLLVCLFATNKHTQREIEIENIFIVASFLCLFVHFISESVCAVAFVKRTVSFVALQNQMRVVFLFSICEFDEYSSIRKKTCQHSHKFNAAK